MLAGLPPSLSISKANLPACPDSRVYSPHTSSQPEAERGPAKVRAHGQVSSPAGLGQTEASACQFLAVTSAVPGVPGAPGRSPGSRRVLCGRCLQYTSPLPGEVRPPEPILQMGG